LSERTFGISFNEGYGRTKTVESVFEIISPDVMREAFYAFKIVKENWDDRHHKSRSKYAAAFV